MLRSINFVRIVSQLKGLLRQQQTLKDQDVKLLFREPGVTGDYRPSNKSLCYYLLSIFQLNNETVNIWTHLIAAILFVHKTYFYINILGWNHGEVVPFLAFGLCSICYALMSVTAHTLHSKSPKWHYCCFQLDYAAIGAYGLGMAILFFHTGCPETLYMSLGRYFSFIQVFLCWIYMMCCCIAKLKYRRPYPFQRKLWQLGGGGLQSIFGGLPLLCRYWHCFWNDDCSMSSLGHHTAWIWIFSASIFFFSSHLPEILIPGKFDFIGQGHQLFHVLVTIVTLKQFDAAYIDVIEFDLDDSRDIGLFSVFSCLIVYAAGVRFIFQKLDPHIDKRIIDDLKQEQ